MNKKKIWEELDDNEKVERSKLTSGSISGKKGILKKPGSKVLSDSDDEGKSKKGITFGKEEIHKINRADEEDDYSGEKAKGSPRIEKPEERDISDGRTAKERVRDNILEK